MQDRDFDALYARYRKYVWTICYRLVGNSSDADEAVQETFVRVVFWFADHPFDPDHIQGFLAVAARNICIDMIRKRGRTVEITELPDEPPIPDLRAEAVQECLDRLPEEQRLALVLKHVEQLTWPEITAETEVAWRKTEDQWRYLERKARAAMKICLELD